MSRNLPVEKNAYLRLHWASDGPGRTTAGITVKPAMRVKTAAGFTYIGIFPTAYKIRFLTEISASIRCSSTIQGHTGTNYFPIPVAVELAFHR